MITKLTGPLVRLLEETAYLVVEPFEYQVAISDYTRRQLQMSLGQEVTLYTLHYIEGNAAGGKLIPRLVGFSSEIEREFFDLFCSVDGVGVKKALRAMVRSVPDIANAIEQQDLKSISMLPGVGPATAERIVAKLRRKMAKFALMVAQTEGTLAGVERDLIDETYQILLTLGHAERDARKLLETAVATGKKFKDVEEMLQTVYQQTRHG